MSSSSARGFATTIPNESTRNISALMALLPSRKYAVYESCEWDRARSTDSFYIASSLFRSASESFIADIIVERQNGVIIVNVVVCTGTMSPIAGETEHHRMWSLIHNGREYENTNDSSYAIQTHVVLSFKLKRSSLQLIEDDHFIVSLWNNLQKRVYRNIPLPFPQPNANQSWNVVSVVPRSVSLSVATHFVTFYARQGASHISLVLLSPYPALKAALRQHARRGFVSFRDSFWDAQINATAPNPAYSMRGVVYQGEFLRSRKDYQVTTFLEMNEYLTGWNLSRFSLPLRLQSLPSVSRVGTYLVNDL